MSFNFVVETGVGDSDANSYVSVEYASDYIAANSYASAGWDALEDPAKQKLLVRASKFLDATVKWNGERVDDESGLRWPRAGVYDSDGFEIADDTIPPALMDAVCELASVLMSDDWTAYSETRGMKQIEVDVVNIRFDDNFVRQSLPDIVINLLDSLGVVNKGARPAFKKIIRT